MRHTGPIKVRSCDADIVLAGVNGTTYWNGNLTNFVPAATLHGNRSYPVNLVGTDLAGNTLALTTWDFTTAYVGTISGTFRDAGERPQANATVILTRMSAAPLGNVTALTTETDRDGDYAFCDIVPGNYTLTVTKDGYSPSTSKVSRGAEDIASGGTTIYAVIQARGPNDVAQMVRIAAIIPVVASILLAFLLGTEKEERSDGRSDGVQSTGACTQTHHWSKMAIPPPRPSRYLNAETLIFRHPISGPIRGMQLAAVEEAVEKGEGRRSDR